MKHKIILIALVAFLVGGISGFTVHALSDANGGRGGMDKYQKYDNKSPQPGARGMGSPHANHDIGQHDMHQDMMVRSEREFIEHMIPHHEEAVMTAKEVLARGGSTPEIRALAESIVMAQEREIAAMKEWHQAWYGTPYADLGTYKPMMRDLSNLRGAELDQVFLEDMIHHHMGAIMMARSVEPFIEREELRTLTEAIIKTQLAEIETMRGLLATL
jgi:uncharacterized protein (DUF305 family)